MSTSPRASHNSDLSDGSIKIATMEEVQALTRTVPPWYVYFMSKRQGTPIAILEN